jgi:hypothetical protein
MNLRSLDLGLLAQTAQFKDFLLYLNVIAEEERRRKEGKGKDVEGNLEGLLVNPEMPCLGGLGTKDQNTIMLLVQNTPPLIRNGTGCSNPPRIPVLIPDFDPFCQVFFLQIYFYQ